MKILQLNIRLTEGGASQVAADLHQRLLERGYDSHYAYGYGSGIKDSPSHNKVPNCSRLGNKFSTLTNFAIHRLIGTDAVFPLHQGFGGLKRRIEQADLIHLHAIHHYFIPFLRAFPLFARLKKPVVMTNHDWWAVTGRCAFAVKCEGWKSACGVCPRTSGDMPSFLDLSAHWKKKKARAIRNLGERLTFVSPSEYIAGDIRSVYPHIDHHVIHNVLDREFERCLEPLPPKRPARRKPVVLITQQDLSWREKTDYPLIDALRQNADFKIVTVGRNSPLSGPDVENLGPIGSRKEMARIMGHADFLLFTSRIDSFGLILIEALASGTPVLAVPSPAASEVLGMVGGRCANGIGEMAQAINGNSASFLYDNQTAEQLAAAARRVFNGADWLERHLYIYEKLIERARRAKG